MMLAPLVAVGSAKVIPALAGEDVMAVEAIAVSTDAEDGTSIEPAIVAVARATSIAVRRLRTTRLRNDIFDPPRLWGERDSGRRCCKGTTDTQPPGPEPVVCRPVVRYWGMRIFFTGGSGKAGKHVVAHLAEQGHQVTNIDLVALGHPGVADLRVDLTDAGETYSALAGLATLEELDLPEKPTYDAVVHFAAVPRIGLTSDTATYAANVLSTYNVLEAATRLGVNKIVFASSETTYGICFAQGDRRPDYVPIDEEHPTVPEDAYAMSKVAGEVTARSFQARTGTDIYGLRINNVIEPHEYAEIFPAFLHDPALRRRNVFAYIDARDLGQMVQRCLETDGLGYEVFNVANADMSVAATTGEILDRFYDGVPVRREMGRDETFYAIDKARDLLGFEPHHSWRDVLADPATVG
ncbi:NAD-dependent epimerase/dehydratase family protein [Aeromicrobium wangtongii]|uniref:NAD(P)-dependent oxidoreductase n=2 Tax=Aeromicrobium wangtongii TaxID=2969247 RepID=A0ABY5MFB5_9ACTN|nr:NAD(P)-dependent oxidoreductase [Aeromicrobium wangtongii]UUP15418.1 NAD(P)-dependent oxidoreductase [Aeromicrobium wangtongii]